ncbi:MAG: photosynthetic reaction center cytochrome c subunit [Anaerolineales bacterium]|nr:photosynthetic reaction center cytochrome c subunit [Anaerolineales bacterium]
MTPRSNKNRTRGLSWIVIAVALVAILFGSQWVGYFVNKTQVEVAEAEGPKLPNYVNYYASGSYITAESNAAIADYIAAFPEPQNVQILTDMNTSAIWGFMTAYMAGGLKVDCTYCHNIENFGADTAEAGADDAWVERKATAREHLLMTADLNQNWIATLAGLGVDKQPSGAQIICATCHYGEALPVAWSDDQYGVPDDYRLPLDDLNVLLITGQGETMSLDAVQYNQYTMYHISESLGVGCTHCHNSRYFPLYEQPAKDYALHMLTMAQYIRSEYQDTMNGQEPSCYLCHRNQVRPPGAVAAADSLPIYLSTEFSGE